MQIFKNNNNQSLIDLVQKYIPIFYQKEINSQFLFKQAVQNYVEIDNQKQNNLLRFLYTTLEPQKIESSLQLSNSKDFFKKLINLKDFEFPKIGPKLEIKLPEDIDAAKKFLKKPDYSFRNFYRNNNKDFIIVAEEVVREKIKNKFVYKKVVWVIIGGVLLLFVYFLFSVFICKSAKLPKLPNGLKSIYSIFKRIINRAVPFNILSYEVVEDQIAIYSHYLREYLKKNKGIYTYPGSIFKLCKDLDLNFTEPAAYFQCLYDEFQKLFVNYCSNPNFVSCENDAINQYSSDIAKLCSKGDPSCVKILLPTILKEIYSDCIKYILEDYTCSQKFKILNKYLKKKYLKQYKKFMESPDNWVLPPEE